MKRVSIRVTKTETPKNQPPLKKTKTQPKTDEGDQNKSSSEPKHTKRYACEECNNIFGECGTLWTYYCTSCNVGFCTNVCKRNHLLRCFSMPTCDECGEGFVPDEGGVVRGCSSCLCGFCSKKCAEIHLKVCEGRPPKPELEPAKTEKTEIAEGYCQKCEEPLEDDWEQCETCTMNLCKDCIQDHEAVCSESPCSSGSESD